MMLAQPGSPALVNNFHMPIMTRTMRANSKRPKAPATSGLPWLWPGSMDCAMAGPASKRDAITVEKTVFPGRKFFIGRQLYVKCRLQTKAHLYNHAARSQVCKRAA